jgi:hypothetical protein
LTEKLSAFEIAERQIRRERGQCFDLSCTEPAEAGRLCCAFHWGPKDHPLADSGRQFRREMIARELAKANPDLPSAEWRRLAEEQERLEWLDV